MRYWSYYKIITINKYEVTKNKNKINLKNKSKSNTGRS